MTHLPRGTGDERVDRALTGLDRLADSPVSGHVAVFEELHATLEAVLAASDAPDSSPHAGAGDHMAAGHSPDVR